jgi:hypothetical protein
LQTANNVTFYFEIAAGLNQSTYLSRLCSLLQLA